MHARTVSSYSHKSHLCEVNTMNRKEAEDFIYSSYMKSDIALLRNVEVD